MKPLEQHQPFWISSSFKLLDQEGHTLVLRPDMTAPIARVAASKLLNDDLPLRLAYTANVFRAQQREGGRPAEFEQIGLNLLMMIRCQVMVKSLRY